MGGKSSNPSTRNPLAEILYPGLKKRGAPLGVEESFPGERKRNADEIDIVMALKGSQKVLEEKRRTYKPQKRD